MRDGFDWANRLAGVAANANDWVDQVLLDGDGSGHGRDFIVGTSACMHAPALGVIGYAAVPRGGLGPLPPP